MASDYFLEIDGIKGESKDAKHREMIDIESFSWGATQVGGLEPGESAFDAEAFRVTHHIDKSSPLLLLSCATGKHIQKATLYVRKATTNEGDYYKVTMSDCLVSSFQHEGGDGDLPTEEVSLNYSQVEFSYSQVRRNLLDEPISSGEVRNTATT